MLLALLACAAPSLDLVDDSEPVTVEADADTDADSDSDTDVDTGPWDLDGDGYPASVDCDDSRADIHPGAIETCNGTDNDCDGVDDDHDAQDRISIYRDADGDGYGDDNDRDTACGVSDGWVASGGDCDDMDPGIHPGAEDTDLDGVDDDCDGTPDQGWVCEGYGGASLRYGGVESSAGAVGTRANYGPIKGHGFICSASCQDSAVAEVYLDPGSDGCQTSQVLPEPMVEGDAWRLCVRFLDYGETSCTVQGAHESVTVQARSY